MTSKDKLIGIIYSPRAINILLTSWDIVFMSKASHTHIRHHHRSHRFLWPSEGVKNLALSHIHLLRYKVFKLWSLVTFDLHEEQFRSSTHTGLATYQVWRLSNFLFLRYHVYKQGVTHAHAHSPSPSHLDSFGFLQWVKKPCICMEYITNLILNLLLFLPSSLLFL